MEETLFDIVKREGIGRIFSFRLISEPYRHDLEKRMADRRLFKAKQRRRQRTGRNRK